MDGREQAEIDEEARDGNQEIKNWGSIDPEAVFDWMEMRIGVVIVDGLDGDLR